MTQQMQAADIAKALATPFAAVDVHFRSGPVSGKKALALPYLDARAIMDRLDAVLGVDGWRDTYQPLTDGTVMCRLGLRFGETWVERADVGGASKQPDGGDRIKAAFSDALKRAAVKFGIGRYLYRVPATWADYDPQGKRFAAMPKLPAWALPEGDDGEGECIGAVEQQTLTKLLAERGKTAAGLTRWLGLPEGAGLGDVTKEQFAAALKTLRPANGAKTNGKGA